MDRTSWDKRLFIQEALVRVVLFLIFLATDDAVGFRRVILPEEIWMYSYPYTPSYYPNWMLWATVWGVPALVFLLFYFLRQDMEDLVTATMGAFLSVYGTGVLINILKLTVGRPRPDFMERCYPDKAFKKVIECTGAAHTVNQGYKSFPSGHSALSFASLAYVALYLGGKLHIFGGRAHGSSLKLLCFMGPLVWASLIAISRTADYHHHWQDVTVGSLLGLASAYCCYRQGYPGLNRHRCHLPYSCLTQLSTDHALAPSLAPLSGVVAVGDAPLSPDTQAHLTDILKAR